MNYLDRPCTRCGKKAVSPPLKKDLDIQPLLVVCAECGCHSRYNVSAGGGYTLSRWGRNAVDKRYRKKAFTISSSDDMDERTRKAGETRQTLYEYGYRIKILGLDK